MRGALLVFEFTPLEGHGAFEGDDYNSVSPLQSEFTRRRGETEKLQSKESACVYNTI